MTQTGQTGNRGTKKMSPWIFSFLGKQSRHNFNSSSFFFKKKRLPCVTLKFCSKVDVEVVVVENRVRHATEKCRHLKSDAERKRVTGYCSDSKYKIQTRGGGIERTDDVGSREGSLDDNNKRRRTVGERAIGR